MTLLFLFGLIVAQKDFGAAGHAIGEQNQRAMSANGERFGEFLEILA